MATPYVTSGQFESIRPNLTLFRKEKHMELRDIRRILTYVCRCLLCYQAYFNQIEYRSELDNQGRDKLMSIVNFLQETYSE